MIKKFLAGFCLLFTVLAGAQQTSYTPYSYYGLGEQRFKGTAEFRSMGEISFIPDSIHLNLQNPASYSSLKLTTFTTGGTTSFATLRTETKEQKALRTTFDYLAVGFPFKKGGVAFGLMPYTSTGYKLVNYSTLDPNNAASDATTTYYEGSGGINRVFAGFGYELTKNFRIGADFSYNFGDVEAKSRRVISGVQYGTMELNQSDLGGFSMNAGVMYDGKINAKTHIFAGLTYAPETKMNVDNDQTLYLIEPASNDGYTVIQMDSTYSSSNKIIMPSRLTFGAGIGVPKKWTVGAQVTLQNSAGQSSRFGNYANVRFENGAKFALGGYYIPNYESFSSYLSRVVIRGGLQYEKTGLIVNDKSITDAKGSIGFGFPVPGLFSNINLMLEYGKRGTVYSGLVEERYFSAAIGLSFNDRWFQKRKYD